MGRDAIDQDHGRLTEVLHQIEVGLDHGHLALPNESRHMGRRLGVLVRAELLGTHRSCTDSRLHDDAALGEYQVITSMRVGRRDGRDRPPRQVIEVVLVSVPPDDFDGVLDPL